MITRRAHLTRRKALVVTGAGITAITLDAAARAGKSITSVEDFNAWIRLRGGEGTPAYWYSEGLIRPIKDGGKVQSRMVGMETWITPPALRTETSAVSLSRKIYFFLDEDRDDIVIDPATNAPRRPSIFVHQVRTFSLSDGAIDYQVESHDLRGIRQGGTGVTMTVTQQGDQVHVNYASFPRRPDETGEMQVRSGEVYDYMDNGPQHTDESARYQMTWVGTNLEGNIANQRGWRFGAFDDIPNAWLKTVIREQAPLWMAPPSDMAEIGRLRNTVPFPVPGLGL
ncbi:MAG: hypothetical protein RIB43_08855 [Rhodospirillaceae bacterium]